MKRFNNYLYDQMQEILKVYEPYLNKLSETEMKDLNKLKSCCEILKPEETE
jgi:hypothetical protein